MNIAMCAACHDCDDVLCDPRPAIGFASTGLAETMLCIVFQVTMHATVLSVSCFLVSDACAILFGFLDDHCHVVAMHYEWM